MQSYSYCLIRTNVERGFSYILAELTDAILYVGCRFCLLFIVVFVSLAARASFVIFISPDGYILPVIHDPKLKHHRGKKNCFQYLLSIFSIGLSAMMCCLGVFGILDRSGELAVIFVSVYMILFSVLLFLYELMWWKSIPAINKNLRTNFGFLYGIKGKAAYLIFVAFLVIGLQSDQSIKYLRYATGACYLGTGIGMLFLHFSKPELLGRYEAPTAGFEDQAAPATAQV
jgi:hypothetical protein